MGWLRMLYAAADRRNRLPGEIWVILIMAAFISVALVMAIIYPV
jgi:hypothetical protein